MKKVLNMTFASSITDLCEVNSSFDKGILRIAYTGTNRNKSSISKETFERCINTIFNCPIVCNYDRESDTFGSHDMEVVRDNDGELRIINTTTPIGCIPESAKTWFDKVEEEDGTVNEYLFAEVLLWKRQEAYKKIKNDGIAAQSMEISVKDGVVDDGIFYINDFEFTAFAIIGVEPCFESASLEVFSSQDFKQQFSEMMQDIKDSFKTINTSNDGDDIQHPQKFSMEGGNDVLDKKLELAKKYGINVENLDYSLDDFTEEELETKFKEATENQEADVSEENPDNEENTEEPDKFALTSNVMEEIFREFEKETIDSEWGEHPHYCVVDTDFENKEVYCWDTVDWLLYGFAYSFDGDKVLVDWESKKRKKYTITDFDEGEQPSPFAEAYAKLTDKIKADTETINKATNKIAELQVFKDNTEAEKAREARAEIFAKFEDLVGIGEFEVLRSDGEKYDLETIEEKCYAIRGKNGTTAKFALDTKVPKIKIEKKEISKEPYGGIFQKFGIGTDTK